MRVTPCTGYIQSQNGNGASHADNMLTATTNASLTLPLPLPIGCAAVDVAVLRSVVTCGLAAGLASVLVEWQSAPQEFSPEAAAHQVRQFQFLAVSGRSLTRHSAVARDKWNTAARVA